MRVFPRKGEGRSGYAIRPFESPRACPFGVHVIRYLDEHDRLIEVPDRVAPRVCLAPEDDFADAKQPAQPDFFGTPEWDYIRRERKHQEIEQRSQQLLINQQDANAHGELSRSLAALVQSHQDAIGRATEMSLQTHERITAMSEKQLAMQQQFLEMGAAMVSTFQGVVEKIKQPPPPADWAGLAKTVFDGATNLGCTLIAAARMPDLPPGVIAARSAKAASQGAAKDEASKAPPRADAIPPAAEKPPIQAAPEAVASLPAVAPTPAKAEPEKAPTEPRDPPDPPPAASATAAPPAAPKAEASAHAQPAPTLRQRVRLACRRFVQYFLSFGPSEYLEMVEDPGALAEYIREFATLAVPPQELIAGMRA